MFDVGFWELVLIFGVGLIILGPERMPRVASQIGRWIGRARRTASSLRRQLEQEIAAADYKPPPPPPKRKPTHITPVNSPNTETEEGAEEAEADDSAESESADIDPDPVNTEDEPRREAGES